MGVNTATGNTITEIGRTSMTGLAPATASVGTSSAQLVAANASRRGLVVINTSVNTVSLGFGANAAVLNGGITLAAGVAWVMDENTFTTQAVNAIASAGSSVVSVQEFN